MIVEESLVLVEKRSTDAGEMAAEKGDCEGVEVESSGREMIVEASVGPVEKRVTDAEEKTVAKEDCEAVGRKNGEAEEIVLEETMLLEAGPITAIENFDRNGVVEENSAGRMIGGKSIEAFADGNVEENVGGAIPVGENVLLVGSLRVDEGDADMRALLNSRKGSTGASGEEKVSDSGGVGGKLVDNVIGLDNGDKKGLTVAELVSKARAPVKSEFLTPAAVRVLVPNGAVTSTRPENGVWDEKTDSRIFSEKKSKRQMKRERLQAKNSTAGICAIVARTGDVEKCSFGDTCRFNHNLQGYKAQKPPDLPGKCPSLDTGEPCFYGIACRYAGTHKECDGSERYLERRSNSAPNEQNNLSKELQKLLWKNRGSYPKADAQLQAMGLMNKAFKLRKAEGEENQIHEPGQTAKEESRKRCLGTGLVAEETIKDPEVGMSTSSADNQCVKEQGDEGTGATEGSIRDAPKDHTSERVELCPSQVMQNVSPPQKRLRAEAGGAVEDTLDSANSVNQRSVCKASTAIHTSTNLYEDEYKSSAMITSRDVQVKPEKVKSFRSEDGLQSLYVESKSGAREKKIIDFREKLYLAPLTTVGNLPFRRVCKTLGADITCGEMAMCLNLLQGQASEWALLRRHSSEDLFGVQICGAFPDHVARTAELIEQECTVDFIDVNMGCPIDLVVSKGAGSCLLTKPQRLEQLVRATAAVMENPLTLKVRMGYFEGRNCAHTLMPRLSEWGVSAVTIHGRTRQQRYSKVADWDYVQQCVAAAEGNVQVIGNGDVFSYTDWTEHLNSSGSKLSTCMIARGALIKPWLFREIKEHRHWDISSGERLDILRDYVHYGLAHWGSDSKGVETTRHFLLEWLSYMHRYIPVGLLEVVPQRLNWRPPSYFGRNDLETMMASESAAVWVRITELLLGPTPANFVFNPKHKSNAYDKAENG